MILITGATGYLGKKIVERLDPSKVIGFSRTGKSPCLKHVNCSILDITPETIPEQISTIIHSAAVINKKSKDLYSTNVLGTKKMIDFAQAKNVQHFIFISSTCTQLEKKNRYALSKIEAENLLVNSGLNYTIIRPNLIYGTRNKQFASIVSCMKKFKIVPVPGNGNFQVAPVHEDDLINAIICCLENKKSYGKIYTICGKNMTYNEFLTKIALSQNIKCRLLHISATLIYFLTYLYDSEFIYSFQDRPGNYTLAAKYLNFMPMDLTEGLKRIFS